MQFSGCVNEVELGFGKNTCCPVGSIAGRFSEVQPVKLQSRLTATNNPAAIVKVRCIEREFSELASRAWGRKECARRETTSRWKFLLRATIPCRLGNIPGCLWCEVWYGTESNTRTYHSIRQLAEIIGGSGEDSIASEIASADRSDCRGRGFAFTQSEHF